MSFDLAKLNEVFIAPIYYRELGYIIKRQEEYERSLIYFDTSLKLASDDVRCLMGRSCARAKACKYPGAMEDLKKILEMRPDDLDVLACKAHVTYQSCEFEEGLVLNSQMLRQRTKPDHFAMGLMYCDDAIRNCLDQRAGRPLRDHFKIIRRLAWIRNIEKQKPYVPISKYAKKKKKVGDDDNLKKGPAMPLQKKIKSKAVQQGSNQENIEQPGEPKELTPPSAYELIGSESVLGDLSSMLGPSTALIEMGSEIRDTLYTHASTEYRIPPAPRFPFRPLQEFTSNIENYMAERYLNKMYLDKLFLKALPRLSGIRTPNQKGSDRICSLAKHGFKHVYYNQELLRTRRPFYMLKYAEARVTGKLKERQLITLCKLQNQARKDANCILAKINLALAEGNVRGLIEVVDKLKAFCESTSKKLLPEREKFLNIMYGASCDGFFRMYRFKPEMKPFEKENRVCIILGLPLIEMPSKESLIEQFQGVFLDWGKQVHIYEEYVRNATCAEELAWLYHELSRFKIELKQYDLASVYARKCIAEAEIIGNQKWIINALILLVRVDILIRNKNDAKIEINHARRCARKMRLSVLKEFLKLGYIMIEKAALDETQATKLLEMRQKQIITILQSQRMKDEAAHLFKKISSMPPQRRMSVLPGINFDEELRTQDLMKAAAKQLSETIEPDDSHMKYKPSVESAASRASKASMMSKDRGVGFMELIQYHID